MMPWFGQLHVERVANFLSQHFLLVAFPDERGRWNGDGFRAPREPRDEPELRTKAPREYSVVLRWSISIARCDASVALGACVVARCSRLYSSA